MASRLAGPALGTATSAGCRSPACALSPSDPEPREVPGRAPARRAPRHGSPRDAPEAGSGAAGPLRALRPCPPACLAMAAGAAGRRACRRRARPTRRTAPSATTRNPAANTAYRSAVPATVPVFELAGDSDVARARDVRLVAGGGGAARGARMIAAACSARPAFTSPNPAPAGPLAADPVLRSSAAVTWATVSLGYLDLISAAMPDTSAAALSVVLSVVNPPDGAATVSPVPGAVSAT